MGAAGGATDAVAGWAERISVRSTRKTPIVVRIVTVDWSSAMGLPVTTLPSRSE